MKQYRINYMIDGIEKIETVFAKSEAKAVKCILEIENISYSYADFSIIKIELYHNKKYYKVTL